MRDVLISDIGMPDEDGYTFIARVRSLSAIDGGRTPAIALTGYARAEDRARVLLAGFQNHLAKPVEPLEILAVVASMASMRGKIGRERDIEGGEDQTHDRRQNRRLPTRTRDRHICEAESCNWWRLNCHPSISARVNQAGRGKVGEPAFKGRKVSAAPLLFEAVRGSRRSLKTPSTPREDPVTLF